MLHNSLLKLIDKMQNRKIMVIGDMVADVYLEGKISRISREAPVLILEHTAERVVPGGAANALHNTATLSGSVYAVGVVGEDFAGQELVRILQSKTVDTEGFIVDTSRPTITKTRVMAGGQATVRQQIVRIDKESKQALDAEIAEAVEDYITLHITDMHGVVISDYGSNTITPRIITNVIKTCQERNIPCIVDSRYNIMAYHGVTVVKQNESEAAAAVGYPIVDQATLRSAGNTILEKLGAQAVLITLGPDGMALFEKTGKFTQIPVTNKSEVYDVTGAGDTVVATTILALAAGGSYEHAARLSNFAAGIVVKKPGTATTNPHELREALDEHFQQKNLVKSGCNMKTVLYNEIKNIAAELKADGKTVVFTNGCFDVIHAGHVRYLQAAKELGHCLILGLNSDQSVRTLKGPTRPINNQYDRAEVISALSAVDYVVIFDEPTAENLVAEIKPAIYVKGGDYNIKDLPEAAIVSQYGGKTILIPEVLGKSSSSIINKMQNS